MCKTPSILMRFYRVKYPAANVANMMHTIISYVLFQIKSDFDKIAIHRSAWDYLYHKSELL